MSRRRIQIETGLIGAFILLALCFWTSDHANSQERHRLRFYGGEGSDHMVQCLEKLHVEIEHIACLHLARPDNLVFENETGEVCEYSFAYNTLWRNQHPILSNIQDFHFEYRNQSGEYGMVESAEDRLKIRLVMFVLRFYNQDQEILDNDLIEIHPQYGGKTLTDTHKMIVVRAD
jgi:hypothetical protein